MQSVEALTILIGLGDAALKLNGTHGSEAPEYSDAEQQLQLAVSVAQAMLNAAIPVARFRCFVKIESGLSKGREFTVCSPIIEDIVAALEPMNHRKIDVYITLWEQRATGAEMIESYQGPTRTMRSNSFVKYLNGLRRYSIGHLAH